jgi:hypothetical protein|tara:strand:- start:2041 stop:2241 length:201 start_codon:yes stop_codon:yes gene_type:complete
MIAREAVGKRIVAIEQTMSKATHGMVADVHAIVLEDGTRLCPLTAETEEGGEYLVEILVNKRNRRP